MFAIKTKFLSILLIALFIFNFFSPCIDVHAAIKVELKRDLISNGIYARSEDATDGQLLVLAQYNASKKLIDLKVRTVENVEGNRTQTAMITNYEPTDIFKGFLWSDKDSLSPIIDSVESVATDIERPSLWLDAADADTVLLENGLVSQWLDKSGNERHMSQVVNANRPVYNETDRYIQTNGTSTYLENRKPFIKQSTQPVTIFSVIELDTVKKGGDQAQYWAEGSSTSNYPAYCASLTSSGNGNGLILIRGNNSTMTSLSLPNEFYSTGTQLHVLSDNKTSMTASSYRDGKETIRFSDSYTNRAADVDVFSIGGWKHMNTTFKLQYPAAGKFKEMLVYQGEMSEQRRIEIEEYLIKKWNITTKPDTGIPTNPLTPNALTPVVIDQPATGDTQNAYYYVPSDGLDFSKDPIPLVVGLHSWSANYANATRSLYSAQASSRGWAMIHPDFRGPNTKPEACASELAVDDIVRAVEFMQSKANIDPNRIYLVGASGGGHMALSAGSRRPEIWAAVSAWVPITDLTQWYYESKAKNSSYYSNIAACCGGAPGTSTEVDAQYYLRSPINFIQNMVGIPLDLNTGIDDGHTGSVPISHTLNAFNKLAEAYGMPQKKISTSDIETMVKTRTIPAGIENITVNKADESRAKDVLFRRIAGDSRVTIFQGGHEIEYEAAFKWLEGKSK